MLAQEQCIFSKVNENIWCILQYDSKSMPKHLTSMQCIHLMFGIIPVKYLVLSKIYTKDIDKYIFDSKRPDTNVHCVEWSFPDWMLYIYIIFLYSIFCILTCIYLDTYFRLLIFNSLEFTVLLFVNYWFDLKCYCHWFINTPMS